MNDTIGLENEVEAAKEHLVEEFQSFFSRQKSRDFMLALNSERRIFLIIEDDIVQDLPIIIDSHGEELTTRDLKFSLRSQLISRHMTTLQAIRRVLGDDIGTTRTVMFKKCSLQPPRKVPAIGLDYYDNSSYKKY